MTHMITAFSGHFQGNLAVEAAAGQTGYGIEKGRAELSARKGRSGGRNIFIIKWGAAAKRKEKVVVLMLLLLLIVAG